MVRFVKKKLKITTPSAFHYWIASRICAFYSSPTAITTHTHTQSHTSMSILLSIFHVQLLCYGNRRRLAMGWLLTADFRSFSLFSPAVLLLALNALLTHSCLLIPSQSLRGVHSMISVIIPCLLAPRPTVIPSVPPHFFIAPYTLPFLTVCLRNLRYCHYEAELQLYSRRFCVFLASVILHGTCAFVFWLATIRVVTIRSQLWWFQEGCCCRSAFFLDSATVACSLSLLWYAFNRLIQMWIKWWD